MNRTKRNDKRSNFPEVTSKQTGSGDSQERVGNEFFKIQLPTLSFLKGMGAFKRLAVTHSVPASVLWANRCSLFLIFFWFGFLKIFSLSPAETLVTHLHQITLSPLVSIYIFQIILGIVECIIGIMWLIPSVTRYTFVLFLFQMFAAFLPLILLPADTWSDLFVLSLPGQYILKNVVLIACAFTIYKDCQPNGWKKCK